jgi:hypothetical protein
MVNGTESLFSSIRGLSLVTACAVCGMLILANLFAFLGARSGKPAAAVVPADSAVSTGAAPYRTLPVLAPRLAQQPLAPVPQVLVPTEPADRSDLIPALLIDAQSHDPLNIRDDQMEMLRERAMAQNDDDRSATLTLEDVEELNQRGAMIW